MRNEGCGWQGENVAEQSGPVHVDGRRYMMGDGFMLMEDSIEVGRQVV